MAESVERSDLPVGQSKGLPGPLIEVLDAYEARIRAQTAAEVVDLLRDGQRYMAWRRQQPSGLSYGTSDVVFAADYIAAMLAEDAREPAETFAAALPDVVGTPDHPEPQEDTDA